ncbi:RraA family protein [Paracoccus laeviglucosivorans]|uniref:Putative 4-hydroxy-4-methyl-2-oxoglutarate aldolase n=1 Tax=Paracoccus laeviglucosivorans TaxID=1197861 RepID=A0A521FTW3_9RHOB|nr:RraA family protein [Paracoccus laeviglucosivorans]SMO99586.1 Regulator of RNase E activity RraA [Paracoccus laeviglucosivorans]
MTALEKLSAETSVAQDYDDYNAAGRIWGQVPRDRITKIRFPRASQEVTARYLALADMTTTVSDLLDARGIRGVIAGSHMPGIIPGKKIAGTAVTLRSIPERKTPTQGAIDKDPIKMSTREVYYLAEPGDVLVADFGGNLDVSNMGGQSCTVAKTTGFVGSIVNGAIRDVNAIRDIDYPVWCKGVTPITGKFRMEAIEINGPVTVHDIVVYAGDLVVADDSGICVVPFDLVEELIDEAEAIEAAEDKMRELIADKAPISELRPLFRKRYD